MDAAVSARLFLKRRSVSERCERRDPVLARGDGAGAAFGLAAGRLVGVVSE